MKINLLSSEVYTQIAAGEVVESPRSIVKELVENSIDAGATAITIYIEEGGLKSITVSDNGCGIEHTEVEKAFLPHATSKISTTSDLMSITTLGFRGEALASIAAVAEVTLDTHCAEEDCGTRLIVKGGEVVEKTPSALDKGTNITVSNLFFNTPARFKFLKAAKTEENNVTAIIQGLILANPDISFTYYIDSKLKYFKAEIGLESACETVFKTEFVDNSIHVYDKVDDVTLEGYISNPSLVRGNRGGQFLIINGRVVSDQTITAVVQNAYGTRLMTRCFPVYCLSITLSPEDVDVNVHPNKTEVRLSAPKRLAGIVYHAVQKALDEYDLAKSAQFVSPLVVPAENIDATKNNQYKVATQPVVSQPQQDGIQEQFDFDTLRRQMLDTPQSQSTIIKVASNDEVSRPAYILEETQPVRSSAIFADMRVVGQIFGTYLIVENMGDVYLIDQHAAHERIRYDKLIKELDNDSVPSQLLLMPIELELDATAAEVLAQGIKELNNIGFDIELKGESITISAIPAMLTRDNIKEVVRNLIAELNGMDTIKISSLLKEKLASKACKGAIKGGDILSAAQISAFVDYYQQSGTPLQCPHGRPTIVKLDQREIDKLFKRIV